MAKRLVIAKAATIEYDHINNMAQKEVALSTAGVTRLKYLKVIAIALEAGHYEYYVDKVDGLEKERFIPDLESQKWAAEQAAKLFGDMRDQHDHNHSGEFTLSHLVEMVKGSNGLAQLNASKN